jgi:hypothetical protein
MGDDWAPQFKSLLSSPLGVELIDSLTKLRAERLADAENASASEQQRLLNQAMGIRLAIEHLQFRGIVPAGEGGKGQK